MSADVKEKLKSGMEKFEYFCLGLDESTDIDDTAQLANFVRGANEKLEVMEELIKMDSLKGTRTGRDVLNCFLRAAAETNLDLRKLISGTIDGLQ